MSHKNVGAMKTRTTSRAPAPNFEKKSRRRESKLGRPDLRDQEKLREARDRAEKKKLSETVDPMVESWYRWCGWVRCAGDKGRLYNMVHIYKKQIRDQIERNLYARMNPMKPSRLRDEEDQDRFEEVVLDLNPYELERRGASTEEKYLCEQVLALVYCETKAEEEKLW